MGRARRAHDVHGCADRTLAHVHWLPQWRQRAHDVNAAGLEDAVWTAVVQRLLDPAIVTDELESIAADGAVQSKRYEADIERFVQDMDRATIKQNDYMDALADASTSAVRSNIIAEMEKLDDFRREAQTRVAELSAKRDDVRAHVLPIESVKEACAALVAGIDSMTFEDRRRVAELVITRVIATREEATVIGALPTV